MSLKERRKGIGSGTGKEAGKQSLNLGTKRVIEQVQGRKAAPKAAPKLRNDLDRSPVVLRKRNQERLRKEENVNEKGRKKAERRIQK